MHSSLIILIVLLDRKLWLAFRLADLQSWCPVGDYNLSTGDQACRWLAVCLVSQINVPIIICLWRKSDLVSQPSSFWVPKNQRMLPWILDVPRRNFHGIFSVELHSWHGRSDADAWSELTEGEEWKCRFKWREPLQHFPKSSPTRRNRLGTRPGTRKKDLFECWKFY